MKVFRITSSTTTTVTDKDGALIWLRLVVSGTPTDWVITVKNKATTPNVFYISDGLDAPATIEVPFPQRGDRNEPVPMVGGIDIVTAGTAGVLDAWVEWRKAET